MPVHPFFMSISNKVTRWNAHQLSSFEQLQFHRERRAAAREAQQKMSAQAQNFASIQTKNSIGMGDVVSRAAMARMKAAKTA